MKTTLLRHVFHFAMAPGVIILASVLAALGDETPNTQTLRRLGTVPEFTLTNEQAETFGRDDLDGKIWIASFFFTRCSSICPRQTAEMKRIHDTWLSHPEVQKIRLVSFSVDPEFDSPDVLAAYALNFEAKVGYWNFLTGGRDAIWNLSKKGFHLGVGENPDDVQMPLFHSSKFVLVDANHQIRGYFDALTEEGLKELDAAIHSLLSETVPAAKDAPTPDVAEGPAPAAKEITAPIDPLAGRTRILVPPDIYDVGWLATLKVQQANQAKTLDLTTNFQFEDRYAQSGITFQHRVVDDAGKTYKEAHYDHGNGVAIADVDGDGLSDLYFVNQVGANGLYKNLGDGTFKEITASAGVGVKDRISVTASFADIDNDGDADLFVTTVRLGNLMFENDGKGVFRDITEQAGLTHFGHSSGAVFFDYNRDGHLDLFLTNVGQYTKDEKHQVANDATTAGLPPGSFEFYEAFQDAFAGHLKTNRTETSILYRNNGDATFSDVSVACKIVDPGWSGDASPLDANNDGWPDLYVLNMQGNDHYFENVEGKYFVQKETEVFAKTPWGSMGIKVFDFNNDGSMDIYVTDMHSDMSVGVNPDQEKLKSRIGWTESFVRTKGRSIFGNALYQNAGDGTYTEVSDAVGAENYWPWGLSVGDLNADGFQDAFVCSSMNFPFRYGVNSLLLNHRGNTFVESAFTLGVEPRKEIAKPWFALDCADSDKGHRDCEGQIGKVVVWGAKGTRSSVIFDLDQDGDLDIVCAEFNSEPMILISNLAQQKPDLSYLKIKLTGSKSNRDGLGAKVVLKAGGQSFTQVYDGVSGYLSHSLGELYFGLGELKEIDQIQVTWPSGAIQNIPGPIPNNQILAITEKS